MLRQRVVAATLGIVVLILLFWLNWFLRRHGNTDDLILLLIVVIMAGVSAWEASRIVRHHLPQTSPWNGVYAALIPPFLVHAIHPAFPGMPSVPVSGVALLIDSVGVTAMVMFLFLGVWSDVEQRGREGMLENLYAVGAGLYLGITTTFLLLLVQTPFHEMALAFLFPVIFSLDTAAYFGGKRLGGPLMAPTISPHKTWAGAVIGLLGAVAMALLFTFVPAAPGDPRIGAVIPWWGLGIIGACIGVVGQMGDLLESAFKRWGKVKDSGVALPGHGGFLDRFDSLFLAAPVCYLLLLFFMR